MYRNMKIILHLFGISILRFSLVHADENSADDSGIGLVVSLFNPGHLSIIPGNPNNARMNNKTGRGAVSIKTYYFNTFRAKIVSMTSDPRNDTLFILDSDSHSVYRMENFNVWLNGSVKIAPIQMGVSKTSAQIAYDWLSKNIYWVDGYFNWIGVQPAYTTDNNLFKIIKEDNTRRPEAIALDPVAGYLFWSDLGLPYKIERCSLLGEDCTSIITEGIAQVYDIAVDAQEKKIYWVDAGRHTIESSDYDGKNRHMLVRMNSVKFTSISVFGKHVYVTSFTSNTVSKIDKNTGSIKMVILVDDGTPVAAEIYDPNVVLPTSDKCELAGCQDICVITPEGARCSCREGHLLKDDKKTCENAWYHRGLMIANSTHICNLDIRQIAALKEPPVCMEANFTGILYIVADALRQVIYYIDSENNQLMEYSMIAKESVALTSTGKNVSGLAYDWHNKLVIWSDIANGDITAYSVSSGSGAILYSGLESPSSLTVNPLNNTIYWISGIKGQYHINAGSLSENRTKIIVHSSELKSPTGLFYHIEKDRIFWINWNSVKSAKTDGSDIKSLLQTISILFFGVELLIYKDHAVWTHGQSFIMTSSIFKHNPDVRIDTKDFGRMTGMCIYDPNLQHIKRGPCDIMNGGCEHVCIPVGKENICKCDYGYTLDIYGKNCSSSPVDDNFILTADYSHGRIYQSALGSPNFVAVDLPDVEKPACVVFDKTSRLIYWVEIIQGGSRIRSGSLDGKNVTTLYTSGLVYPDRIALDSSTGHLYYTAVSTIPLASYVGVLRPETGDTLKLVTRLGTPRAIVLHPSEGLMFWTDHNKNNPHIGRSYMDGTFRREIINTEIKWPNGLAIDYKSSRLYWADGHTDRIESSDLHGKDRKVVLQQKQLQLVDIALSGKTLYYTAWNSQKISVLEILKNGTGVKKDWMENIPEFGRLDSIEVVPGEVQPIHKQCSKRNGRCSVFCLPTQRGRTCGCGQGTDLMPDGLLCRGVYQCTNHIPNGQWEDDCLSYPLQSCKFTCKSGFRPKTEDAIFCNQLSTWNSDPDTFCIETKCDIHYPVKVLANNCSKIANTTCEYECADGFIKNVNIPSITCQNDGKWNHDMKDICRPPNLSKVCKDDILFGGVSIDCQRVAGERCSFHCDPGYLPKEKDMKLLCLNSGKWDIPGTEICTLSNTAPLASQQKQDDDSSTKLYAGVGGAAAAFVVLLIVIALIFFFVWSKRKRSMVGQYETQHNVYCVPEKGIINLASDVPNTQQNETDDSTYSYVQNT